jgi:hypothetical protein
LWVTSAGTACGIAEYTARLRCGVPFARLTATMPDLSNRGVVHVQHEPNLMDDTTLEHFTALARDRGVPVAITQHAVAGWAAMWEHNAQALVAATSGGALLLRERHPDARVVHIPLGCETWCPPRKTRRGRTIGLFGFPGWHKGFARLTEAVRGIDACDVLLVAYHPTGPASLPDWPSDVPLRWENEWIPLPEVAARLAAETDVLVFHYDEVGHRSASSAVTLGLSTGVPVLTSATDWFADLGPAVHRAGTEADTLASGLEQLLEDDDLRELTTTAAREYCVANSWSHVVARHVDLWSSLEAT